MQGFKSDVVAKQNNNNFAQACEAVKKAVTFDSSANTVTLHLKAPYGPILQILTGSWAAVVSKAWVTAQKGWDEIGPTFDWLEKQFSNCASFEYEVVSAGVGSDLAYLVGIEHTTASVRGEPPSPYSLRVTTILRREDGRWKVVHRHADPYDASAGNIASRLSALA